MSRVMQGGKVDVHRPSWNYAKDLGGERGLQHLEMLESVRNVLEQIRDSQMMQCDVALAIKTSARELRLCRLALQRMARRKRPAKSKTLGRGK